MIDTNDLNPPRFLPTLTEVVDPASLSSTARAKLPLEESLPRPMSELLTLVIDRHLGLGSEALIRALVTQDMQSLKADLQRDLETLISQRIHQLKPSDSDQHKDK